MNSLPYFAMDLAAQGLLPADWEAQVRAAADAPERVIVPVSALGPSPEDGQFSILPGPDVRARLGWLWDLYLGPMRDFVTQSFGQDIFPANRVSSAITLNILAGEGATAEWHVDATAMTGIFFAATRAEGEGGELQFRDDSGETASLLPRVGTFVCFPGSISHRVAPLLSPTPRLAFALLFYASAEDQPFASADDRHEMSHA